jgi:hypothetical protein
MWKLTLGYSNHIEYIWEHSEEFWVGKGNLFLLLTHFNEHKQALSLYICSSFKPSTWKLAMQLGNTQYLQVGKNLNVTTNFNHLGGGGGGLGCKDPAHCNII